MPTVVTPQFAVNDTVFHVSLNDGVREGVVRSQNIVINATLPPPGDVTYNIGYKLPSLSCAGSSVEADEADLFATLPLALTEYELRILAA